MIPRQGRRHHINRRAVFQHMTEPLNHDDATMPTLIVGGVRISAYLDSDGRVNVSVYTDEDELDPAVWQADDAVAMRIVVNDTTVYKEIDS